VDLYIHFPIRLHGVVLNLLSTETTLPVVYLIHILKNCSKHGLLARVIHLPRFKHRLVYRSVSEYGLRLTSNFRLSWQVLIDVNTALGCLRRLNAGIVADVSEVHAATTLRVDSGGW
jgi:hypothetical protein